MCLKKYLSLCRIQFTRIWKNISREVINSVLFVLHMEKLCLLQNEGCTVLVSGGFDDDLGDIVSAAHQEWKWLRSKERAIAFADHR